ncbi:polymer-forming cytoskeletal protein [Hydrogenophaga sp.]|uniref:bactofilin family protein n=1 Tax=Hydrogenophaga sp. TaxID=1904254 RepID=UPI00261BA0B8|nr:polymer-forming cytoskeletal protein [Hydrogenophaga sp.]MCW5654712.1 polymer-forming cytoskeletal protein [Hydrogenophaga sp.]
MNDSYTPSIVDVPVPQHAPHPPVLQVPVGNALSAGAPPQVQPVVLTDVIDGPPTRSLIAEGMLFTGNAQLRGPCSIAGVVEGNLSQAPGSEAAVVVTETGRVKGDISAVKISVMGQTEGILDAGQGEVSLHDTARVQGTIRYGRIQVNGADLNATLERALAPGQTG